MVQVVLLVAVAWVVLAVLGAVVLAPLALEAREALLPAAPVVGAAFLVVVLHGSGLFLPVRWGLLVVAVVALGLLGLGFGHGLRAFAGRSPLLWTGAGLLAGVPFSVVAVLPSLRLHDSRIVSPSGSHDAFFYVSVIRWLIHHPILDVPTIAGSPAGGANGVPGDGPAVTALTAPLRVGEELVQAALDVVTGRTPLETFSPWIAAWVLIVPGACVAAASLFGLPRRVGLAAGVVIASSAVLVQQVYAQNAASVLGIALVLPALGCVVAAVDRHRSVPLLFAAMMLAGLVGTYTEYAPFVAPAVAGAVLLRRRELGRAVLRGAALVGMAVVIAPLVWWRAVGTVTNVRGGAADAWPSPYLARPVVMINRLTGAGPLSGGFQPSIVAAFLGLLVLGGIVLTLVVGRHRGMWAVLLVVGLGFLAYLSVERLGYTQRRAVELAVPLALFMAVAGWFALIERLQQRAATTTDQAVAVNRRSRTLRAVPLVAAVGLLVSMVAWTGVNVRSSLAADDGIDLRARHVDDAYAEALSWVRAAGATRVSVLAPDYYEQHGIALTLEGEKGVEYPALRPDYLRTQSYWAGATDRFWLLGEGVQVDADPGVVVHSNARFRMLDLHRGKAVVAAPSQLTAWYPLVLDHGDTATVAPGAEILVIRSAGVDGDVSLRVRSGPESPVLVRFEPRQGPAGGGAPALVTGASAITVTLPAGDGAVVLDVVADVPHGGGASSSIELEGIHRVR